MKATSDSEILNFYKNKNILITGGSGFMGKILIQKLLRECTDLSGIYLLIREKKSKDVHSRSEDFFNDVVFDKLKEDVPDYANKVVFIEGDCSKPDLGLSEANQHKIINNINIIFNMAASLNMDSKLKDAVQTNVRGLKELVALCHEIQALQAVVHVSTAYSNCNNEVIEERFYDPPISGQGLINLSEELDDKILTNITSGLIDNFPNTYVFTKCVAENIIFKEMWKLPIAIFRPSVITNAYKDPLPGWINNVYGPSGMLVASGVGLLRVLPCDGLIKCDMVPVDLCVNALITTPWHLETKLDRKTQFPIYNYSAGPSNSWSWNGYRDMATKHYKFPSSKAMWPSQLYFVPNTYLHYFIRFIIHNIPAIFMDSFLCITGRQPKILKIYKKIHKFVDVLSYFIFNEFNIVNKNVSLMWDDLNDADKTKFPFDMNKIDWDQYFNDTLYGIKYYLLKEDPKDIENDLIRYKRKGCGVQWGSISAARIGNLVCIRSNMAVSRTSKVLHPPFSAENLLRTTSMTSSNNIA